MNEASKAGGDQQAFFWSKPRLIHLAVNIAIAPILLYPIGAWSWPPALPHYIVFAITFLMAVHYARQRWKQPQLVLDANGLTCGHFYPTENICKAKPSLRSVTLTVLANGRVKNKVVSLGWASREDCQTIQRLLVTRFPHEFSQ